MPIREESFRIGCGRYIQKRGGLQECAAEIQRLGCAPLLIGGKTAFELTRKTIEESVAESFEKYEFILHEGSCNEQRATELAALAAQKGYDVIVGIGGGVLMDFAKLTGSIASLPVLNIPTSSATCAAFTPLSVCYTPDGRTVGSKHFPNEVNAVLADTEIIATQPVRLLLSGVFDALAKFVEIKQRFDPSATEYPLGLDWAYVLSERSFNELINKTEKYISDIACGQLTDTVEQVIFTTIAATGVISGIARGSNQCALAHKFYECTRKHFFNESRSYLHGEIVGIGLLLQNHFNGECENNDFLCSLMEKYNMPRTLNDIGIEADSAAFNVYYDYLRSSSAIEQGSDDELERLEKGLKYLFEMK